MDALSEVKDELRSLKAQLQPLRTALLAEVFKEPPNERRVALLRAEAAPLEQQILALEERAKQLESQTGMRRGI